MTILAAVAVLGMLGLIKGIFGFLILALMIFCIIDVLSNNLTSGLAKTLWILGLLCFPLVGSIVYLVMNKKS